MLDWVYGYRGKDSRANLAKLPTGEVVYYVASVVVLYSAEAHTQRHYRGHTEDIESICVHPQEPLCATGQAAAAGDEDSSHVQVWNYETLELVHILGLGELTNRVAALAFSIRAGEGGSKLAIVDGADQPNISIWTKFEKKQIQPVLLTSSTASSDRVLSVRFYEKRHNILVTCGKSHLNIWSIEGDILMRRQGLFTKKIEKPKYVICVAFANSGEIISGDTEGNLMVWRSVKVVRVLKGAHTGPVADICVMDDGSFVSGGVSDGALVVFDSRYDLIGVGAALPEQYGGVRTVVKRDFQSQDGVRKYHLYVGTTTNSIVEVLFTLKGSTNEIQDWEVGCLLMGHYQEAWGIASHPEATKFLTCGYDGNVILWDGVAHTDLWTVQLNGKAHCCAISPDGSAYAVGTMGGVLHLGTLESKEHTLQSLGEALEAVAFSPDGNLLAVAGHDRVVHVFKFETPGKQDHKEVAQAKGHNAPIRNVDWSTDSKFFRSQGSDLELLYWEAATGTQVNWEQVARLDWASQTCTLTFETVGLWGEGGGLQTTARHENLVAGGDAGGRLRMASVVHGQQLVAELQGHGDNATAVTFLQAGDFMVSAGGQETHLLQWRI